MRKIKFKPKTQQELMVGELESIPIMKDRELLEMIAERLVVMDFKRVRGELSN
jgi:hypothetical protein